MNRIYLRAFEPEDHVITYAWRQDKEITNLLGGNHYFVSREREREWVRSKSVGSNNDLYLAICLIESDDMIGYCSLNNIDLRNQKCEWGGTIIGEKEEWGKGYASESARLMLCYLFDNYPINKCYAYCLESHLVTQKMFSSLGFVKEGTLREDIYKNGTFNSVCAYSMLKNEFELMRREYES